MSHLYQPLSEMQSQETNIRIFLGQMDVQMDENTFEHIHCKTETETADQKTSKQTEDSEYISLNGRAANIKRL